jgi:hypothetical protein
MLHFIIHNDEELKEKVLDVFIAQTWHHEQCFDEEEGYHLFLLSQLYEEKHSTIFKPQSNFIINYF